jgi:secondary thiamine-phosphate synthase enzyme
MKKTIKLETGKLFTDITNIISGYATEWGKSGIVSVFSPHTTLAIWLTENEILHHADIRFFLDSNAPITKEPEGSHKNVKYLHDMISLRNDVPEDERINGHSHIRYLFFNSSETIPIDHGKLVLGEWKKVFAVELDPIRPREIICTFVGG